MEKEMSVACYADCVQDHLDSHENKVSQQESVGRGMGECMLTSYPNFLGTSRNVLFVFYKIRYNWIGVNCTI